MASRDIASLDLSSLERFRTELIKAGFEPGDGDLRIWIGPIADELKDLTSATTMTVVFCDGWPFRPPRLLVEGLDEAHVGAGGEVCLWRAGVDSGEWLTLGGYNKRIGEWARRVREGFQPEDFALDTHLFFRKIRPCAIATVKLKDLRLEAPGEKIGVISATWEKDNSVLEIVPGLKGRIEGRWYGLGEVKTPPRGLDGVRALLSSSQRNNFNRRYRAIEKHGKSRIFMLIWNREFGQEVLVLMAEKCEKGVVAESIEVALTDLDILKLRAGPDSEILAGKRVAFFGLGAIGSNTSLRLAEAGLGHLVVVDGERLRPGDIVRHATGSWAVGDTKVSAVHFLVHARAPWTKVAIMAKSTWNPDEIGVLIDATDLVVEATGLTSFANLLSVLCEQKDIPLVSSALYRGGSIMRVRRQTSGSCTIYKRSSDSRYPVIPAGTEPLVFEPGCSSPVNNASPVAVASAAALTAEVVIDSLTGRNNYTEETIDVYRPLENAPFDRVGRVSL